MKPWLYLPVNWAHHVGPFAMRLYSDFCISPEEIQTPSWQPLTWKNLIFKNRVGIAGGVDKNAECIPAWWKLGAGFVEIGTVTPKPQDPNPGKIIDRHLASLSLWNKMGFPSHGSEEVAANLRKHFEHRHTPILVNIGKNRNTRNEDATSDYLSLIQSFNHLTDIFVVNISSPNTQGLRELQKPEALKNLLGPLIDSKLRTKPILVKLSPDMGDTGLTECVRNSSELGIDGFVITNTSLSRITGIPYPAEGGMSGAPLKELSKKALQVTIDALGPQRKDKLIINVGGVVTPDDVFERLRLGADLVQTYSGLVYHGPHFFKDTARKALAE